MDKEKWKSEYIRALANSPYPPSNGTEGMSFVDKWCGNCINEKWMHTQDDNDTKCEVLSNTFVSDDFSEWFYDDQAVPYCRCFKKWDWGFDDGEGGGLNEPPPVIPDDPMQLCMPFIIEDSLKELA